MLEQCQDILKCESILAPQVRSVRLLGEIPLSDTDRERLAALIRSALTPNAARGTRRLTQHAPTCFACFLVHMGRTAYQEGDYWSAVHTALGTAGGPLQTGWGRFFLAYLAKHDLPTFAIEGAYRYVTPILLHGGIPDHDLDEFFDDVVRPLALRHGRSSAALAAAALDAYRENAKQSEELRSRIDSGQAALAQNRRKQRRYRALLSAFDDLVRLDELEAAMVQPQPCPITPVEAVEAEETKEYENALLRLEQELDGVRRERAALRPNGDGSDSAVALLLQHEQAIHAALGLRRELCSLTAKRDALLQERQAAERRLAGQWPQISDSPWRPDYAAALRRLDLKAVRRALDELGRACDDWELVRQRRDRRAAAYSAWASSRRRLTAALAVAAIAWATAGLAMTRSLPVALWMAAALLLGLLFLARCWRQQGREQSKRSASDDELLSAHEAAWSMALQRVQAHVAGLPLRLGQDAGSGTLAYPLLEHAVATSAEIQMLDAQLDEIWQRLDQMHNVLAGSARLIHANGDGASDEDLLRRLETAQERAGAARTQSERRQAKSLDCDRRIAELEQRIRELRSEAEAQTQVRVLRLHAQSEAETAAADQLQAEAAALRDSLAARLGRELPAMQIAFARAKEQGKDKAAVTDMAASLDATCTELEDEIRRASAQLEGQVEPLALVSKPIRRYLLYNGDEASSLLVSSVSLLHASLMSEGLPADAIERLPDRIVRAFESWWATNRSRFLDRDSEKKDASADRSRAPIIRLDTVSHEVMLSLPVQRLPLAAAQHGVALRITSDGVTEQLCAVRLQVYQVAPDEAETDELRQPLPLPASSYRIALEAGDREVRSWTLAGWDSQRPYLSFSAATGREWREDPLPRLQCWLVTARQTKILPESCVVQEESMHGGWSAYACHLLDLREIDRLALQTPGAEDPIDIPLSDAGAEPELAGSRPLAGVWSKDAPVYADAPPDIRIPIDGPESLSLCSVTILREPVSEGSIRRFRLSEVPQAISLDGNDRWATLALNQANLLGAIPAGRFVVQVHTPSSLEWSTTFCVLPALEIKFQTTIYAPRPHDQPAPTVSLSLYHPAGVEFRPEEPCRVVSRTRHETVIRSPLQDTVRGGLQLPGGSTPCTIPLAMEVPMVRWRLASDPGDPVPDWLETIEEDLWLGDWEGAPDLLLDLKLPSTVPGPVTLVSDPELGVCPQSAVRNGLARFNLAPVRDSLRAAPPVTSLAVDLGGEKAQRIPLCSVRNAWEVIDLECVQTESEGQIELAVRWLARGKADGILLRLWAEGNPALPSVEILESGQSTKADIHMPSEQLPPGGYWLQFVACDPWLESPATMPTATDLNVRHIEIVSSLQLRKNETLRLEAVEFKGMHYEPKAAYQFRVIGKIVGRSLPSASRGRGEVVVKRGNEGWYLCDLIAPNDPATRLEIAAGNPFKLDYRLADDRVVAIEDRNGEGAMYCPQRRCLVWRQEAVEAESENRRPVLGPIEEFRVRWTP